MYMVAIAARIRNSSLESDAWNAWAAPWKAVAKLAGSPISCSAFWIAVTAAPSDDPGARLNEIVVAGNWPRCEIFSGDERSTTVTIADSGTCPPATVDEGRYIEP